MGDRKTVRRTGIDLENRSRNQFYRQGTCGLKRHDLVIISMNNQGRDGDLLNVFPIIQPGECLDALDRAPQGRLKSNLLRLPQSLK